MSNIKLYEAVDELREILDQVDPETGELPEEFGNVLGLVKNKAAAVAAYVEHQASSIAAAEEHVSKVQARIKQEKARREWLKSYLMSNMNNAGIREIKGEGGLTVKLLPGRDKSVEIFDERQVPVAYRKAPPRPEDMDVMKTAIAAALKAGRDVPGARIVAKDRLEIKP